MIKKIALLGVKYGPSIMVLSTCFKILFLNMDNSPTSLEEIIVNIINLLINILIVGLFYCLGKTFGYCWKHRSLCRTAFYGYVFYAIFILTGIESAIINLICILYVILVVLMNIFYKCENEVQKQN